jgi:sugar lactone lactonase YvrE
MPRRPSIHPVVWRPPPIQDRRRWRREPTLPPVRLLRVNGLGPEDVAVTADGQLLTGLDGGKIIRVSPDGRRIEEVVDTDGRPLGIEVLPDGTLLVCDAYLGLLHVDPESGKVDVLVSKDTGTPLEFCNDASVARDGTIYFSDSSARFGFHEWKADLLEHSGTGRLLRRNTDGEVETLLDGLQLANGVALTPDESAVIVAETGAFRLTRRWLTGPRAGTRDVLADDLPGYPWGISCGTDGLIWVAIASPRNRVFDGLSRTPGVLRKAIYALPEPVHPKPVPSVWVLAVDPGTGAVVRDLHGPREWEFLVVTGVREHHGTVFLGSVVTRALAAIDLQAYDDGATGPAPARPPHGC